jgi:hypothetical protein
VFRRHARPRAGPWNGRPGSVPHDASLLPSRLSRSAPESHRVCAGPAAPGARGLYRRWGLVTPPRRKCAPYSIRCRARGSTHRPRHGTAIGLEVTPVKRCTAALHADREPATPACGSSGIRHPTGSRAPAAERAWGRCALAVAPSQPPRGRPAGTGLLPAARKKTLPQANGRPPLPGRAAVALDRDRAGYLRNVTTRVCLSCGVTSRA